MSTLLLDRKTRTAGLAALFALLMTGVGFAAVPLYRLFCAATGLNGTTQRGLTAPGAVVGKTMTIRFDANHVPALPWTFAPEQATQTVTVGERNLAFFTSSNLSDRPVTGQATYNVTPVQAGRYFTKIQCFCFTEQTLKAGEHVRMPVIFYVDPKILTDPDGRSIEEITLSYIFYPVDAPAKAG